MLHTIATGESSFNRYRYRNCWKFYTVSRTQSFRSNVGLSIWSLALFPFETPTKSCCWGEIQEWTNPLIQHYKLCLSPHPTTPSTLCFCGIATSGLSLRSFLWSIVTLPHTCTNTPYIWDHFLLPLSWILDMKVTNLH